MCLDPVLIKEVNGAKSRFKYLNLILDGLQESTYWKDAATVCQGSYIVLNVQLWAELRAFLWCMLYGNMGCARLQLMKPDSFFMLNLPAYLRACADALMKW